jgi:hypothetical protein
MVIAWDRQSGVSRSIPRWLSLYARSDPAQTERSSFRGGYATLESGVPAMSGGGTAEIDRAPPRQDGQNRLRGGYLNPRTRTVDPRPRLILIAGS